MKKLILSLVLMLLVSVNAYATVKAAWLGETSPGRLVDSTSTQPALVASGTSTNPAGPPNPVRPTKWIFYASTATTGRLEGDSLVGINPANGAMQFDFRLPSGTPANTECSLVTLNDAAHAGTITNSTGFWILWNGSQWNLVLRSVYGSCGDNVSSALSVDINYTLKFTWLSGTQTWYLNGSQVGTQACAGSNPIDLIMIGAADNPANVFELTYIDNVMLSDSSTENFDAYFGTPTPTSTQTPPVTATSTRTITQTSTSTRTSTITITATITPTITKTAPWTATRTSTLTSTPTVTGSSTRTITPSPSFSITPSSTSTSTSTNTPTRTPTPTPSFSYSPTFTRTVTTTRTSTVTPTNTVTKTATPVTTATKTVSATSTASPTASPTVTPGHFPVSSFIQYGGDLRPAYCTDFNLVSSMAWTYIDPGCTVQPCVVDLAVPATAGFTMSYHRSLAATTPTVNGADLVPGQSKQLLVRPGERVWYKMGAADNVSATAQGCTN